MTEPVQYSAQTPRHGLPLLFPGQAQKEFFVNAAFSLCDALMHPLIEGEAAGAPASAEDGQSWLVADGATGEFAGRDGSIARRQASAWIFIEPKDGLRVFDRSSGGSLLFNGQWRSAGAVDLPVGGSTVDAEAREAVTQLISTLRYAGILSQN